jgi:hypothetical protein
MVKTGFDHEDVITSSSNRVRIRFGPRVNIRVRVRVGIHDLNAYTHYQVNFSFLLG